MCDTDLIILEAGCGISLTMDTLSSSSDMTVGLDISAVALNRANRFFEKPLLIQADLNNLPFKNNSFDLIYNVGVIEHFVDPIPPIKEMQRVLKPSGNLIISVPNLFTIWTIVRKVKDFLSRLGVMKKWKFGYERSYSKKQLENLFQSVGLGFPEIFGSGTFEAFYITFYFSFGRPKFMISLLFPLFVDDKSSVWGRILHFFATNLERIDFFGMNLIATYRYLGSQTGRK